MTIFDFLVVKNENFGFENPYEQFFGNFEEFWKNRKNERLDWAGGVTNSSLLKFLETIFFAGPVTFLKSGISKKNFFGFSLGDYLGAKLI